MGRATAKKKLALGRGQKSLNYNNKVNFKVFIPNFVCVLTNRIYKTYQTGFFSDAWVMPKGWDLGVPCMPTAQGVKSLFFRTWSCSISN